jgi:hypothetical protein
MNGRSLRVSLHLHVQPSSESQGRPRSPDDGASPYWPATRISTIGPQAWVHAAATSPSMPWRCRGMYGARTEPRLLRRPIGCPRPRQRYQKEVHDRHHKPYNQLFLVDCRDRLAGSNLLVHLRLRERWLVEFVVAPSRHVNFAR